MKILQVCAYTAQYGGNFVASLTALDARLGSQGIETMYLFPETVQKTAWCQQLQKTRTVFFAGMNRFSVKTLRQVKDAMADADIVHSHFELYDCLCALAKKKHQRLFWHLHDSFDENIDFAHRLINRVQYGCFGHRAVMISPNRFYADYTVKLGFPAKQIHIVDNCIDCRRLESTEQPQKKQYDFFVYGGFYRVKGLDILMDACRLLASKELPFTVGIVGYPDTWKYLDENYPDLTNRLIRQTPSEDVSAFYDSTRVFLSTSRRECFSYALLEALYKALPVIASDIPGNQWAKAFGTVNFFESEDPRALAECMEQFLIGQTWFTPQSLAQTAQQVQQQYNCAAWAQRIEEIYLGK